MQRLRHWKGNSLPEIFLCYKLKMGALEKSGPLNGAARLKLRVLACPKRRSAFLK